jgi:hypothetical protein
VALPTFFPFAIQVLFQKSMVSGKSQAQDPVSHRFRQSSNSEAQVHAEHRNLE